eukprot:31249_1
MSNLKNQSFSQLWKDGKQQMKELMEKLMNLEEIQLHDDHLTQQHQLLLQQINSCNNHCQKITKQYTNTYSQLTSMQFANSLCIDTAKFYPNNIESALNWILPLKRLKNALEAPNDDDSVNIDDYLHLLIHHNTDHNMEYIYHLFGGYCAINECNRFKRNYRDRSKNSLSMQNYSSNQQLIDKMHCYYMHSFDFGYRLNATERKIIQCIEEQKCDHDHVYDSHIMLNKKLCLKYDIINEKQKKNIPIQKIQQKNNSKYNQITQDNAIECNNNKYSFGYKFIYGYNGEVTDRFSKKNDMKSIEVDPKYESLKEELTQNKISALSMMQFNSEQKKSEIHFQSYYCKETFKSVEDGGYKWIFNEEYVLCLMIYCNYT